MHCISRVYSVRVSSEAGMQGGNSQDGSAPSGVSLSLIQRPKDRHLGWCALPLKSRSLIYLIPFYFPVNLAPLLCSCHPSVSTGTDLLKYVFLYLPYLEILALFTILLIKYRHINVMEYYSATKGMKHECIFYCR